MNSKSLRRLAADHSALYSQSLPPNYLFPPSAADTDDLTSLDILITGPACTPFSGGVWKLHLTIPPQYPQQPPTAHFRTPIFHPNVEPQSGAVCVETLKRDWDAKLTLRDVLVTVSCLLIQPNPDSALNAEAGALIQEGYESFARRARLLTGIHAGVPKDLQEAAKEAQMRGQEVEVEPPAAAPAPADHAEESTETRPRAPIRRRRAMARLRGAGAGRRSDGSPSAAPTQRRQPPAALNPFITQPTIQQSDPFSISIPADPVSPPAVDSDASMSDSDQENETNAAPSASPRKVRVPRAATPRRPPGAPVPLGELTLEDAPSPPSPSDAESSDMEPEYPPSPRKSPSKSPAKRRPNLFAEDRAESSRTALLRGSDLTPPNASTTPLAASSPFTFHDDTMGDIIPSPRKGRLDFGQRATTPPPKRHPAARGLFAKPAIFTPVETSGRGVVAKTARSPSSCEKRRAERQRCGDLDEKLWRLCGGDVRKWNRGDFGNGGFGMKAARW